MWWNLLIAIPAGLLVGIVISMIMWNKTLRQPLSLWKRHRNRKCLRHAITQLTLISGAQAASATPKEDLAYSVFSLDSVSDIDRIRINAADIIAGDHRRANVVELLDRAIPVGSPARRTPATTAMERVMQHNDYLRDPKDAKAWFLRAFELTL